MITSSIISNGMIELNNESLNSSLKAGDILKGKIESFDHGRSLSIRLKGRLFKTEIPQGLKVGKEYLFEVKSTFPQILLSLANSGTSITLTADTEKISKLGENIFSLLGKLSLLAAEGGRSHLGGEKSFLLSFLNLFYSGNGAEAIKKLIDLFRGSPGDGKGFDEKLEVVLGKVFSRMKGENNNANSLLKNELDILLKNIESFRHSPCDHYPIPFLFDDEAGIASLHYDQERNEEGKNDEKNLFTLNIEFTGLGEVQTVVRLTEGGMVILFHADNEESKSIIIDNIPLFRESMEKAGLYVSHVDAFIREKGERGYGADQENVIKVGVDLKV